MTPYERQKARALTDPRLIIRDGRLYWLPGPHNASTYRNHRCRCETCRADNTAESRLYRAARAARLAADPSLAEHGDPYTYSNWGCRCDACTRAHSAENAARYHRRQQRRRAAS